MNAKGVVKESAGGMWWIECCGECRELYLDINEKSKRYEK